MPKINKSCSPKNMAIIGVLVILALAATTTTEATPHSNNAVPSSESSAMRIKGGSFVFPPEAAFPSNPTAEAFKSNSSKKSTRGGTLSSKIISTMRQPAERALRPLIVSSVAGAAATGGWYRDDDADDVDAQDNCDQDGGGTNVASSSPESYNLGGVTNYQTSPTITGSSLPATTITTTATSTVSPPTPQSSLSIINTSSPSTTSQSSTATTPATNSPSSQKSLSPEAILYMSLLALQFGIQPLLVRRFTPSNICRSTVVMTQEVVKFAIGFFVYFHVGGSEQAVKRKRELAGWNVKTWLALAGLPAALYTIQNLASLLAYQNLEALTFNVLNQTKILSAALCCFLVMGKRQSKMQLVSLLLLLSSALIIEKIVTVDMFAKALFLVGGRSAAVGGSSLIQSAKGALVSLRNLNLSRHVTHGVIPVLLASFISGLAGALTQKNLQGASKSGKKTEPRNAYLFSMEMNVASVILLFGSMLFSADGKKILSQGFFHNWTPQTLIPVLTNSIGGIMVGLVTKHAGSVRKGFALIFGLLLSGIIQAGSSGVSKEHIVGGVVAAVSLWMHTINPYKPMQQQQQKQQPHSRRLAMGIA
uniref:Sugar phosphate transporter domain-containing protein n=1 Tax=Ditylum brightwellii TaxID=49249 RepID=A0A7S1YRA0_9STRA|mmetsp:Transcript_14998/g.22334  ORF Transcript_14998/g.22334 Transcript_14998/m.22334 type:complete len:591 (+) Transcript_14998:319-2091(+)